MQIGSVHCVAMLPEQCENLILAVEAKRIQKRRSYTDLVIQVRLLAMLYDWIWPNAIGSKIEHRATMKVRFIFGLNISGKHNVCSMLHLHC